MGSFMGHVVPGTFFTGFAMWWLYNVLYRYLYSRKFKPNTYKNTLSYPAYGKARIPVESIFKVVAVAIGIIGEFATAFEHGKFTHWGNMQHITMFFFFGLNGVIDLLIYKRWVLPPKLDYVSAALACGVEGFIFYNHLHDRKHMDIQVHMFIVYVTMASVVSIIVEMIQPTNVMPALCRVYFTLLQGTWFFQVGFILYPPIGQKWNLDDHGQMMIVTLIFTWHMAIILITMMGLGMLIWYRIKSSSNSLPMYQIVDTNEPESIYEGNEGTTHNFTNGHAMFAKSDSSINRILDSDSEGDA